MTAALLGTVERPAAPANEHLTERLRDYPPPSFVRHILSKLPAPTDENTGEALWESGHRPTAAQMAMLIEDWRFQKVDGGIRGGKSLSASLKILIDLFWRAEIRKILTDRYGIIGDTYAMAEEEMNHLHRMLEELGIPHEFRTPQGQKWLIRFYHTNQIIETLTASDVTKIASKPYRGLVLAEAAQLSPDVLTKAIGRVSQGRGWVLLEGTFEKQKGRWYARLSEQWRKPGALGKVYAFPTWDNVVKYPLGRVDPEILERERTMPRGDFLEMYAGDPQMPSDIVFPEANETYHIRRRFPTQRTSYDPEFPVYLAADPGIAHAHAVHAIQIDWTAEYAEFWKEMERRGAKGKLGHDTGNVIWVIDSIYRWNREAEAVIRECSAREWAPQVKGIVIDFAARQRKAEGPPVVEQWAKGWRRFMGKGLDMIVSDQVPLMDGYQVHRTALRNSWPEDAAEVQFNWDKKLQSVVDPVGPRLYIDPIAREPFFGGLVDAHDYGGEYYLHRNPKDSSGSVTSDTPVDRDNDAIKAMNYFLFWWTGPGRVKRHRAGFTSYSWELTA